MRNCFLFIGLVATVLLSAAPSGAHHAVHGRYDYAARITLTGRITRVDWVNPHVRILLDVTERNGSVTTWEVVSAPAQFMRRSGLSKSKLMNDGGEPVTFLGIRARNADLKQIWAYRIKYADGRFYDLSVKRPAS